jgi:hypothetical protein
VRKRARLAAEPDLVCDGVVNANTLEQAKPTVEMQAGDTRRTVGDERDMPAPHLYAARPRRTQIRQRVVRRQNTQRRAEDKTSRCSEENTHRAISNP